MAECSVSSLMTAGRDFQSLTKKELQVVIAQLLCEIYTSGGGGGGGGITCGNYGGNEPNFTPTTDCAVAIDTSTERIWWYYSASWH